MPHEEASPYRLIRTPGAGLARTEDGLRFINMASGGQRYTNAQIDNYAKMRRSTFPCRPPLRLEVRARFSHPAGQLQGTAGFGFWNDPFLMTELQPPVLPRALWFFYSSPPSDMALATDIPGHGWKAACIDALHWRGVAALPLLGLALPALWSRRGQRALWPFFQHQFRIAEAELPVEMTEWRTYTLDWQPRWASFAVDKETVLQTDAPPAGPLGLVVWLDNQYLVARPTGELRSGVLARAGVQWMEINELRLDAGA
jgi:hypothetical protein